MTRRILAITLGVLAALGCSPSDPASPNPESASETASAPSVPTPTPPNIVLYVSDTLRDDGLDAAFTPNLDRLAAEGTRYDRAFASTSWTRPSITSILTGLRPEAHGVEGTADRLEADHVSLPELLKQRGYATGAIVANPNVGSFYGFSTGFDDFIELYQRSAPGKVQGEEMIARADEISQRAIEWIDAAREPWLLFVLAVDPHAPFTPPAPFDRLAKKVESPVSGTQRDIFRTDLDEVDREKVRALYHGEVAWQDYAIKPLLARLERDASIDRTVFVFTSDHGEEFWEHGRLGHGTSLFDEVLRVPLIVRDPRAPTRGERIDAPVETVDLVPTLLQLAGVAVPEGLDGQPLALASAERTTFASLRHQNTRIAATARRGPWKLVWNVLSDHKALFHGDDQGEHLDRSSEHPDIVDSLFRELEVHLEDAERRRQASLGERQNAYAPPPPELLEALEALGYVEEPPPEGEVP